MRFSKDKVATFEEINFPSGVYDYEDLNQFIDQKIGKLGDENYGINILFDISTYKVFIKLDENYQIDLAGSGNFNELLSDSIVDGMRSDVFFAFPTNTKIRALPFKEYPEVDYLWSKINTNYISRVRIWVTDDEDRKVDLNDIDISLVIVMKTL